MQYSNPRALRVLKIDKQNEKKSGVGKKLDDSCREEPSLLICGTTSS